MGNVKHTPGPWKARDYKTAEGDIWIDCDAWKGKKSLGGTLATAHKDGTGGAGVTANARLIAAAPEMLEALKAVAKILPKVPCNVEGLDGYGGATKLLAQVWRAIAKAERGAETE